ncbi:hypothetical protein POM88_025638 [Heracleum sosnowskyi]|uniref:BRO1 domain-containing protein n=1 Tax=Heracleum sosnowskyi TaxID=360622 RepID=A0AAD8I4A8_9APIA|nr:hypothetical protein POM88_025638 [Heracleum sosnowskyi]
MNKSSVTSSCVASTSCSSGKLFEGETSQVRTDSEEATAPSNVASLNEHTEINWHHVQFKTTLFLAEACGRYATQLYDKKEFGEEIAWLKKGIDALYEAKKSFSKGSAHQILDAFNTSESNLKHKLERAM